MTPFIQPIPRFTPTAIAQAAVCATAWAVTGMAPVLAQSTATPQRVEIVGTALPKDSSVAGSALRSAMPIEKTPQSVIVLTRSLLDEQGTRTVLSPGITGKLQAGGAVHTFTAGVDIDHSLSLGAPLVGTRPPSTVPDGLVLQLLADEMQRDFKGRVSLVHDLG